MTEAVQNETKDKDKAKDEAIDEIAEVSAPRQSSPNPSTPSRATYAIVALLVVVAWTLYHRTANSIGLPIDDGYISLHSAQVLHWGADPNFRNVAPLAGVTNAPYVLLLYLLLFFLPPITALHAATLLGILCYTLGLIALGRAFRLPWPAILTLTALGSTAGFATYQLLNGVETGTAMGATVWIFALAKANTIRSRRAAAILCGTAPFLRPELVVLSAPVLLAMTWQEYIEQDCGQKKLAQTTRSCLPLLILAAIAAAPWLLWYGISTGTVIPQSIAAKRLFYAEACATPAYRWMITRIGIRAVLTGIGFLALSLIFLLRSTMGKFALAFIPVFVFAYYKQLPAGFLFSRGRYAYILLPIFLLGLITGLADRSRWIQRAAYVLLGLSCLQTAKQFPETWAQFVHDRDTFYQSLTTVADWTNHHLPPNATVLIHDAGYISYATKFQLIDFVGLKTPSAIEVNRKLTYASCGAGRAQAISEIARESKSEYLIVGDEWDRGLGITSGLRDQHWGVKEIAPAGGYHVFQLTPPD